MKILILTNYFYPEIGGASHLYFQLSESLVGKGHEVTVITGFPRYNVDKLPAEYRGKIYIVEKIKGIKVVRTRIPKIPRKILFLRGIEHFLSPFIICLAGLIICRHDVILVYSPPLPLGLSAYFISRIKESAFVINIQDLFPEEAILLGLLNNKILIKLFKAIERFIYKKASFITVHSSGNKDYISNILKMDNKIAVVHNWTDIDRIKPGNKLNEIRKELKLEKKFIVSYAGTMGWCQDMNIIVEAADVLKSYYDIIFLLIGEGPEKERTIRYVKKLNLENVSILPIFPYEKYIKSLEASDICIINLNKNLTTPVVPSKLLNIMAAERPVVASLPLNGDTPKIIAEAKCGICVDAADSKGFAKAILALYKDPELCKEFGINGRIYASRIFSREINVSMYEKIFLKAINSWSIRKS